MARTERRITGGDAAATQLGPSPGDAYGDTAPGRANAVPRAANPLGAHPLRRQAAPTPRTAHARVTETGAAHPNPGVSGGLPAAADHAAAPGLRGRRRPRLRMQLSQVGLTHLAEALEELRSVQR